MTREVGATDITPSGGTIALIGRRGEGWIPIAPAGAREDWLHTAPREIFGTTALGDLAPVTGAPPYAQPGEPMALHFGRSVDMSRVVREDERGLVLWVPSGAGRLVPTTPAGGGARSVPLDQRFRSAWVMRESVWRGPGVLRVIPAGAPWSVWWFWNDAGEFEGWYVNLELPHRRSTEPGEATTRTHTRDLVLDLWLAPDDSGTVEVWLKDADELEQTVPAGRYTEAEADGIRAAAERFCREIVEPWAWPLSEAFEQWRPTPEFDAPLPLPDTELIRELRAAISDQ
ncbi:DUF402 domain-containing protein [Calidifontibacter sp. DB0510]|uniref:DUF402 domain-containing protein n=1 Tax=Metallococcus carri TaxID=1656884 RepID=A0A967B233_9MICO|nr:DUF402 domain-containing protein [Metallococcus carri]NHN55870.1 DUF402 domain-containing protein [Metallococcus carri]NOP38442.1 DUF402 domain-containing protein [Calidifontibacter sp. DB2511S]